MKNQNHDLEEKLADATRQVEELKNLVKKYKFCKLTGLMKDYDFNETFHRLFNDSMIDNQSIILGIVDIDYLHNVNKKGWLEGNKLIKKVAEQLQLLFKKHHIFRVGGDEFCILARTADISLDDAKLKLESVDDVTFCVKESSKFATPSDFYKNVDKKLQNKKLSRPKQERK